MRSGCQRNGSPMDELTEREFREIRDLIVANDRRVFEHLRHEHETQTARIGELTDRLNHHNDFERRMADQAARFIMRPEFEDAKAAGVERYETNRRQFETKIEGEMKPLRTAIDAAGKPNWTILATAFSIMVALCAGGWLVIGLKIDNTVAPVALSLEQAKAQGLQNADRLHFIEARPPPARSRIPSARRTGRRSMSASISLSPCCRPARRPSRS
jgi:hypothetical protein